MSKPNLANGIDYDPLTSLTGVWKGDKGIATRYEKTAVNYMGMLSLAAVLVWLC